MKSLMYLAEKFPFDPVHFDFVIRQLYLLVEEQPAVVSVAREVVLFTLVAVHLVFLQRSAQLEAQTALSTEETLHTSEQK